ncbi:MAG: hypothetical protein EOP10_15665, partial [Proteobacteria bacterium]
MHSVRLVHCQTPRKALTTKEGCSVLHPSPSSHHTQFLTIEGGEGVGKSFLSNGLKAKLEALGHRVKLTREPGG